MQAVDVLLTQTAFDRFGERLSTLDAGIRPMRMQPDGSLLVGEREVAWEDAAPEVAWATADLFDEGAPLRPFFGFLLKSETIRWLQSPAAGFDAPVFGDLLRRGIRLTNSHASAVAIAEYVVASVLDVFQRRSEWRAAAQDHAWRTHDFREVNGTTWLVIGLGHIGRATSARARAMGARVIGVRRRPTGTEDVDQVVVPDEVHHVLGRADVVLLSAPATAATHHLVDEEFLRGMKEGSVLVNVARGSLVDEAALVSALDRGVPAAAVLDVFETEPLPADHPLWTHPCVVVTPHNAAGGTGRYERAADEFLSNLEAYLSSAPLTNEVTEADLATES